LSDFKDNGSIPKIMGVVSKIMGAA